MNDVQKASFIFFVASSCNSFSKIVKMMDRNGRHKTVHFMCLPEPWNFQTFAPEKEGVPPFCSTHCSDGVHVAHGTHQKNCRYRDMDFFHSFESNGETRTIIITDVAVLHEAFARWQAEEAEKREKAKENTLISAKEASQRLGVTLSTLWRWEREKYLVPIKIGKRNTYRLSDVLSIMEGGIYGTPNI